MGRISRISGAASPVWLMSVAVIGRLASALPARAAFALPLGALVVLLC